MGKIKLKYTNGSEEEKSVISAFKVGSDSFVVFDSEKSGSMGLPIILVSKLIGDKVSKVLDQNEWQKTKEYLKLIISSAQMEYIVVPSMLNADEIFSTQLTLPQASFDAIKNNYKPVPSVEAEKPFVPNIEVTPIVEEKPKDTPVIAPTPQIIGEPTITPVPITEPVTPAVPLVNNEPVKPVVVSEPIAPVPAPMETPAIVQTPVAPIIEPALEPSIPAPEDIAPVIDPVMSTVEPQISPIPTTAPVITPEPSIQNIEVAPTVNENSTNTSQTLSNQENLKDIKENFMKSCENMFDALIKQFENK